MIGIICLTLGASVFTLWMWYEIKHPMTFDDEHEEAVWFRNSSKEDIDD